MTASHVDIQPSKEERQTLLLPQTFRVLSPQLSTPVPLRNTGKRQCRATLAAASPGNPQSNLYFFADKQSSTNFVIDTGAAVSVFLASPAEVSSNQRNDKLLIAANSTPISTFGERIISIRIGESSFQWPFILAQVTQPIIGGDFLRQSGLLVDVRNRKLVKVDTGEVASISSSMGDSPSIAVVSQESEYVRWLHSSYPVLITPTFLEPTVKHGVFLQIPTNGRPVFARVRGLPPDKLAPARAAFDEMTASGVVRPSDSNWSSPLHLVPKEDGSWRLCGDF